MHLQSNPENSEFSCTDLANFAILLLILAD